MLTLKKYAEKKGWKFRQLVANGEEDSYLFTIVQYQGYKIFMTSLVHISEDDKQKVILFLSLEKNVLKVSEMGFDNHVLYFKVRETFSTLNAEKINNILRTITNYLKEHHIGVIKHCVFCHEKNATEQCYLDGIGYYTHHECLENAIEQREKQVKEYDKLNKHYIFGTFGAILFALLATIPWIIASYFGWFVSIFGYFIGKGALFGYKTFGGKLGSLTRWIILLIVIVAILLSEIITFGNSNDEVIISIFVNSCIGFIMAILGILPLFNSNKISRRKII